MTEKQQNKNLNLNDYIWIYSFHLYNRQSRNKVKNTDKIKSKLNNLKQKIKDKLRDKPLFNNNKSSEVQPNDTLLLDSSMDEEENKPFYNKNYINKLKNYYQIKKNQFTQKKEELINKANKKVKRYHEMKNNQSVVKKFSKVMLLSLFIGMNSYMFIKKFYYGKTSMNLFHFLLTSGVVFLGLNFYIQHKIKDHYKHKIKELLIH
jgi:cation transport ATPase